MALEINVDHWRGKLAHCKEQSNILQFGVNHKLLKSEEDHQKAVLQELKEIELSIKTKDNRVSRTVAQIFELKNDIEVNVLSLEYLANISNLEKLYSELTGNVGACAIHQSLAQNFSQDMFSNKPLTSNVKECWSYISRLAQLSQVHLRNASHYQQFHHDLNETTALLSRRWTIVSSQVSNFEAKGTIKEAEQLTNNLKDHLSHFLHLWDRGNHLLNESKKIVPVNLRQDPISQNKVIGHCLMNYTNKDITLADREEIVILNNSNPQFWKVQNSKGEIGEVPSVCLWIPGPDDLSTEKAVNLRKTITTNWQHCLNRYSIVLIDHYIKVFERILSEPTPAVAKLDQFRNLLRDVEEILVINSNDMKSKELRDLLVRVDERIVVRSNNDLRNNRFYKESEIIKIHTPLLQYKDHLKHIRLMLDAMQSKPDFQRMREDQESREQRMSSSLFNLERLKEENKVELHRLLHSMDNIPNDQNDNRQQYHSQSRSRPNGSNILHSHNFQLSSDHIHELQNTHLDPERYREPHELTTSLHSLDDRHEKTHHRKRAMKVDSQTQLGVTVRDSKIQCTPLMYDAATYIQEDIMSITDSSLTSSKGKPVFKTSAKNSVDVQTQIGIIFKDSSTQDELDTVLTPAFNGRQKHRPKKTLIDSITQIGYFTESTGTQVNLDKKSTSELSLSPKAMNFDAMTQIGVIVTDKNVQAAHKTSKTPKRDCQTQIGRLQGESTTQTSVSQKSIPIQTSYDKWDVITQIAILTKDGQIQTDFEEKKAHFVETSTFNCQFNGEGKSVKKMNSKEIQTIGQFKAVTIPGEPEKKHKVLQIGSSRLDGDMETSCQIEQVMIDIDSQTITDHSPDFETLIIETRELSEEAARESPLPKKGKKVQVGFSKIYELFDSSCQTGRMIMEDHTQTEVFCSEIGIEKSSVQMELAMEQEGKAAKRNKKIQVGDVRTESDFDTACQTGSIVKEFETQTDEDALEVSKTSKDSQMEKEQSASEGIAQKQKKVQMGYSKLLGSIDTSCQTGVIVSAMETQTENDEELINIDVVNGELHLEKENLCDEETQFEKIKTLEKKTKGKKLQVGDSKLVSDFEVSCQTGHVVKETGNQTDGEMKQQRILNVQNEMAPLEYGVKNFTDAESQFTIEAESIVRRGKKIQVGYPQINHSFESSCQTGSLVLNSSVQTEEEEEVMEFETREEVMENQLEELLDENIQFEENSRRKVKNKKSQVGESRMISDMEVSCQTGHVVKDSGNQTEISSNEFIEKAHKVQELLPLIVDLKEFLHTGTQSAIEDPLVVRRGKKIQVGYSRIQSSLETSCQTGAVIIDSEMQTEDVEEVIIFEMRKEESQAFDNEMIDEEIQFIASKDLKKEVRKKKLQVGDPRLTKDVDALCQTGRVIKDCESQTDIESKEIIMPSHSKEENTSYETFPREFVDIEIQSDIEELITSRRGKKIQVGFSRMNESIETSCQTGTVIMDVEAQTDNEDVIITHERRVEEMNLDETVMFDEEVQFDASKALVKDVKMKKVQVGNSKLQNDSDVSCQTGRIVTDFESQTTGTNVEEYSIEMEFKENQNNELPWDSRFFCDKEIQPEDVSIKKHRFGKKVQSGPPMLNGSLEASCQSGVIVSATETQTELEETTVLMKNDLPNAEALKFDDMIDNEVQFHAAFVEGKDRKPTKGKKLQVGHSRLNADYDVSCQSGHVIENFGCQTDVIDLEEEMIDPVLQKCEEKEIRDDKVYLDKEIQHLEFEIVVKEGVNKKVQVGYPRMYESLEVSCQSGLIIKETEVQTENEEPIIKWNKALKSEAALLLDEMIEDEVQFQEDFTKEKQKSISKGKKLQIGSSRLDGDFEVSCQAGHVIMESESQTDFGVFEKDRVDTAIHNMEESEMIWNEKEFVEKEMQSTNLVATKTYKVNKKVQVGYPRVEESLEVSCQSGVILEEAAVQTEIEETILIMSQELRAEADLELDELFDEEVQFVGENVLEDEVPIPTKGKKLQVGNSRLNVDFDVSCQAGHIIMESGCQTEFDLFEENIIDAAVVRNEEREMMFEDKGFTEKEIQTSAPFRIKTNKLSKKIQFGQPRIFESLEVSCQSGVILDDAEVQTEIEETMIFMSKSLRAEAALDLDEMCDEEVQFVGEDVFDEEAPIATKGKKLQVGNSRLNVDFDVSCQAGHIIMESGCQTEFDLFEENIIDAAFVRIEEKEMRLEDKEFADKEIQPNTSFKTKMNKISKKVQFGYPRVCESLEVSCQSGVILDNVGVQTDMDENIIIARKALKVEEAMELDEMVESEVQYMNEYFIEETSQKNYKGKKIQVGSCRLIGDDEVSCQAGHLIVESSCQTEVFDLEERGLEATLIEKEESEKQLAEKAFAEKEIQSEEIASEKRGQNKKIQVGHTRLDVSLEVACQMGLIVDNVAVQTEIEEIMIAAKKGINEEFALYMPEMYDEEIQFETKELGFCCIKSETKPKKLQVGSPRIEGDFEVSCQSGCLVVESYVQTEISEVDEERITEDLLENEEKEVEWNTKEFSEKQTQSEERIFSSPGIGKKIQVGYPRLNIEQESSCQSGVMIDSTGVQTEVEEVMIIAKKDHNFEEALSLDEMVDEEIQCGKLSIVRETKITMGKGKKLQVGTPRLSPDLDVSCQTGYIIGDSECQTEMSNFEDDLINAAFNEIENEEAKLDDKEYLNKEIQANEIVLQKPGLGKKVQVGYPMVNELLEVSCQMGVIVVEIAVQTDFFEETVVRFNKAMNEEACFMEPEMVDDEVQHIDDRVSVLKVSKGKKVQVGGSKIISDYEVSCQTGRMIIDSECQTEALDMEEYQINEIIMVKDENENRWNEKEFSEKHIQCHAPGVQSSGKKIQVGHSLLNESLEVSCQSGVIVLNVEVQTEVKEEIVVLKRDFKEENQLDCKEMIDEEVQFMGDFLLNETNIKDTKGKKLQVGSSRLNMDIEVSCQAGHIIENQGCQTDLVDEDEIDAAVVMVEEKEVSWDEREFINQEIQCKEMEINVKNKSNKKVQAGHPLLNEASEVSCQSGILADNAGVQTELIEYVVGVSKAFREECQIELSNLIDEEVQSGEETLSYIKQVKGKKLQVGSSRLTEDFEMACQIGHIVVEADSQTELELFEDEITETMLLKEEQEIVHEKKEFSNKDVQSAGITIPINGVGKKIQVGYPKVNECVEVSCQSGIIVENAEVQTEVEEETLLIFSQVSEKEAALSSSEMIDEDVQYDDGFKRELSKKETKGKKLQVGSSRLDLDLDVSCQTGRIVVNVNSQVEMEFPEDESVTPLLIRSEERNIMRNEKEFAEKEIQSTDVIQCKNSVTNKIVQAGLPKTNVSLEVSCQSGSLVEHVSVQTHMTETFIVSNTSLSEEFLLKEEEMIDEEVQNDCEVLLLQTEKGASKGKKVQVGSSRLNDDFEVSCQAGHIIADSECQTDLFETETEVVVFNEEREKMGIDKEFTSMEVQTETLIYKDFVGKKVQVGYPRMNDCLEVSCQFGIITGTAKTQTEQEETTFILTKTSLEETALISSDMIDEEVQYLCDSYITEVSEKDRKGKKLQVGTPRLLPDIAISCQAGHIIVDSQSQTDLEEEWMKEEIMKKEEAEWVLDDKEFVDKEIQSEGFQINKEHVSKKVQVGHPRMNGSLDASCQSGDLVMNAEIQTEFEEAIVVISKARNEEAFVFDEPLVDEEVQNGEESQLFSKKEKDLKGKKLQVGNPRLDLDFEVACQTGHIVVDSQNQTENGMFEEEMIEEVTSNFEENERLLVQKDYSEKEIQVNHISVEQELVDRKVQVGFPQMNESEDVSCQFGVPCSDASVQKDSDESLFVNLISTKKEQSLILDDMIDEEVEYVNSDFDPKDTKGKKVQVGSPRLYLDSEVSCQTGRIIVNVESQTESEEVVEDEINAALKENQKFLTEVKMFASVEVQSSVIKKCQEVKKVQIGLPKLNPIAEGSCQTGVIVGNVESQTETEETLIIFNESRKEENALEVTEMIDEGLQYGVESFNRQSQPETKGKKLQVGSSKLLPEIEVSTQVGHLQHDSKSQTVNDFFGDNIDAKVVGIEKAEVIWEEKEYAEKEIQSEDILNTKKCISIVVQVGYPMLCGSIEKSCQMIISTSNVHIQTDVEEENIGFQITDLQETFEALPEMIDEELQYSDDHLPNDQVTKDCKGKKLQVGTSRLGEEFEASCQTGHVVADSGCQVGQWDFEKTLFEKKIDQMQNVKTYAEKEVQSENILRKRKMTNPRAIQAGYPHLHDLIEVSVQSEVAVRDIGVVTDFEEVKIVFTTESKQENSIDDEMIDEEVQSEFELIEKEYKGKKVQVGISRLNEDFNVSCQTGHIVVDFECQADLYEGEQLIHEKVTEREEQQMKLHFKDFAEKEIQPDHKASKVVKKVQVGYPRLTQSMETSCQSEVYRASVMVQTDKEERIQLYEILVEMIDEELQCSDEKETQEKSQQIGYPRLKEDFEVASQAGHPIVDNGSQTDEYKEQISPVQRRSKEVMTILKNYSEKEVQSEDIAAVVKAFSVPIQAGFSRINKSFEVSTQSGVILTNSTAQTDLEESLEIRSKVFREEASLIEPETMDEEVQYTSEGLTTVKTKGKKLQVGNSRLCGDINVASQSESLLSDSGCQTERDSDEEVRVVMQSQEKEVHCKTTEYVEIEVQPDRMLTKILCEGKKVQVGFPRLNESTECACQSSLTCKNTESQTDVEEIMILCSTSLQKVEPMMDEELLDEAVQSGEESLFEKPKKKESFGKKVQVGPSRLDVDFEVSCQAGHIVTDRHCQTEIDGLEDEWIQPKLVEGKEKTEMFEPKEFLEKEVKSIDSYSSEAIQYGKKIQVGYPRLTGTYEVSCQKGATVRNAKIQTDVEERIILVTDTRKEKAIMEYEEMIEQAVQCGDSDTLEMLRKKERKDNVQQVGDSRIFDDFEVACQAGHVVTDSECQTKSEGLIEAENVHQELMFFVKDTVDKEVQNDVIITKKEVYGKKVQVGYPRLNESLDISCQSHALTVNNLSQTEMYIRDITLSKVFTQDQEIQHSDNRFFEGAGKKSMEGKKLQVGNSRLLSDSEGFSQTDSGIYEMQKSTAYGGRTSMEGKDQGLSIKPELKNMPIGSVYVCSTSDVACQYQRKAPTDQGVQTNDYTESHSVSLQISPKLKYDHSANLILNYFDKQVDIDTNKFRSHKNSVEYQSVDVQKDSKVVLVTRMVQNMSYSVKHTNKLTSFEGKAEGVDFSDQFSSQVELLEKLVGYAPRYKTYDQCFEFNGTSSSKVQSIDNIPKFITKDNIRLFETISTQVTDDDITIKEVPHVKVIHSAHHAKVSSVKKHQTLSTVVDLLQKKPVAIVSIEHDSLFFDETDKEFKIAFQQSMPESCEGILGKEMVSYCTVANTISLENEGTMTQEFLSKIKTQSIGSGTHEQKMIDTEVICEEITRETKEVSLEHDTFDDDLKERKSEMAKEQLSLEWNVVSLTPKVTRTTMRSIFTDSLLEEKPKYVSLAPKYVQDSSSNIIDEPRNKTTSTPDIVERCHSSTQIYLPKTYNGGSQTSIPKADYAAQVTDFSSMPPTPTLSPIPGHSTFSSSGSCKDSKHIDVGLDIAFEDEYVFETLKSRSVVTTKQEILPKLSHDFADKVEESANSLSMRTTLRNTKTQSSIHGAIETGNQTEGDGCVSEAEILSIYHRLLDSRCVKEQGVQGSNVEGLFEIVLKNKGPQYILRKYQQAVSLKTAGNQTENQLVNSVKTQFNPYNMSSISIQTIRPEPRNEKDANMGLLTDRESSISILSTSTSRPAHRNMRIQRGCSYFKLMDVATNTEESFGDHIEVTYTETILEESIITKRPRSHVDNYSDDNQTYSRSSSLNRNSQMSTPIPVSSHNNRHTQTSVIPSSQIFLLQETCDFFLNFNRIFQVTAVYDHVSARYVSLLDAISAKIINLEEDRYKISDEKTISIEKALNEKFIR